MLEFGIGRAHNLHLSSLPGFTLPGDTASASRYWDEDIVEPVLDAVDGMQQIPDGPRPRGDAPGRFDRQADPHGMKCSLVS